MALPPRNCYFQRSSAAQSIGLTYLSWSVRQLYHQSICVELLHQPNYQCCWLLLLEASNLDRAGQLVCYSQTRAQRHWPENRPRGLCFSCVSLELPACHISF